MSTSRTLELRGMDRVFAEVVRLEVKRYAVAHTVSLAALADMSARSYDDVAVTFARRLTFELCTRIASKEYDSQTVEYPETWWDAFKLRWFPRWALKRWPPRYAVVLLEASAFYPEIAIEGTRAFVEVVKLNKPARMWSGA